MATKSALYTPQQVQLAQWATALANPVRVLILEKLATQTCCYHGDLSLELPIANSTLSQHLNVLKAAGLIQGDIMPPKVKYCIHQGNWAKARAAFAVLFAQPCTPSNCQ